MNMKLIAGERYVLTGVDAFARVLSGEAEVYAVSREATSFRQMYILTVSSGETAYPSGDELGFTDVQIYALTDIEIDLLSFSVQDKAAHVPEMRRWFRELVQTKWLALLADRGDEALGSWRDGTVLSDDTADWDDFLAEFWENQTIFAALLGAKFLAEDKRLTRQTIARIKTKYELLDGVVANLLGEDAPLWSGDKEGGKNKSAEELTFIAQTVAHRLAMDTECPMPSAFIMR